jgi:catechol 2,3-dioxygenase-like lactoylglutathione lyase family enzyme
LAHLELLTPKPEESLSGQVLTQLAEHLSQHGIKGAWTDGEVGHGPAFRFPDPDGHLVEIYYETERFVATGDHVPGFKNLPQRYSPHGIAPRRLDHINLLAKDVKANREFFQKLLELRVTEQIMFDDGTEAGGSTHPTQVGREFYFASRNFYYMVGTPHCAFVEVSSGLWPKLAKPLRMAPLVDALRPPD